MQQRPGPRFNIKISYHLILLVWATPMLKERRLVRRLSVNMGLPILVRWYLYIETGPRAHEYGSHWFSSSFCSPVKKRRNEKPNEPFGASRLLTNALYILCGTFISMLYEDILSNHSTKIPHDFITSTYVVQIIQFMSL